VKAFLLPLLLLAIACEEQRSTGAAPPQSDRFGLDSLRCGRLDASKRCIGYDVSIYELLARPRDFQGRRVRVVGFVHFEFEGDALYPHREDWQQALTRNGLWIQRPNNAVLALSDHYVVVEGRFDATSRGHFGMWSGTIDSVTRLDQWGPFARPSFDTTGAKKIRLP
jgi:hypothetical protein